MSYFTTTVERDLDETVRWERILPDTQKRLDAFRGYLVRVSGKMVILRVAQPDGVEVEYPSDESIYYVPFDRAVVEIPLK